VLDEADRLMEHSDIILKLWCALPKGGAGAARLQVRDARARTRPCCPREQDWGVPPRGRQPSPTPSAIPSRPVRLPPQVLMFSATLHSPEVKALAQQVRRRPPQAPVPRCCGRSKAAPTRAPPAGGPTTANHPPQVCQNPLLVDLKGRDAVPDTVDHTLILLDPKEDRSWLQSAPQAGGGRGSGEPRETLMARQPKRACRSDCPACCCGRRAADPSRAAPTDPRAPPHRCSQTTRTPWTASRPTPWASPRR
jgi:hypothetical protein